MPDNLDDISQPAPAPHHSPTNEDLPAPDPSSLEDEDSAPQVADDPPPMPSGDAPGMVIFTLSTAAQDIISSSGSPDTAFSPVPPSAAAISLTTALEISPNIHNLPLLITPTPEEVYAAITETFPGLPAPPALSPAAMSLLFSVFNEVPPGFAPFSARPAFDAVAFVNSLPAVDVASISAEDMRCPHCWLPFGTTDEDDPSFAPDSGGDQAVVDMLAAFRALPDCECKADNDPIRTPCGHIFGRGCLIESLEKTSTTCPICRHEFG